MTESNPDTNPDPDDPIPYCLHEGCGVNVKTWGSFCKSHDSQDPYNDLPGPHNPLGRIYGLAKLLRRFPEEPEFKDYADELAMMILQGWSDECPVRTFEVEIVHELYTRKKYVLKSPCGDVFIARTEEELGRKIGTLTPIPDPVYPT